MGVQQLVLLQILKPIPNARFFPRVHLSPKPRFLAAVSDGFGSSVREMDIYSSGGGVQATLRNTAAVVVGKGGAGK